MDLAGEASQSIAAISTMIAEVDVVSFSDDELGQLVIEAEALVNAAHALSATALDAFDHRGTWAADGALSAAGWVAARTGTASRTLRARAGAGLRLLPTAEQPARAGRLSPHHLTALAGCSRRHPDLAARDEAVLVELALHLAADAFGVLTREWEEHAAAADGPDPTTIEPVEPVDELHLSASLDGRYQLDGSFSAETGQLLAAALEGEVDRVLRAARHDDPSLARRGSEVRAQALVDLLAQTMRREPSEASVPDRYRVAVVVHAGGNGPLPAAACDAPAFRLVLSAPGDVLDVGRLTQQWSAGIRRAITYRDGGCMFPGCDRPPSWCDIHHCQPWNKDGKTSIDNGALLCRRHHTFIHKRHWRIAIEEGRAVTRRPDGTRYVIQRWPVSPAA